MKNILIQRYNDKTVIFGRVIYEDGLPAKYINVVLEGVCPLALKYKRFEKCKSCKLKRLNFLSLTTTDKNGNFIFVIKNRRLIYSIRVINELIQ